MAAQRGLVFLSPPCLWARLSLLPAREAPCQHRVGRLAAQKEALSGPGLQEALPGWELGEETGASLDQEGMRGLSQRHRTPFRPAHDMLVRGAHAHPCAHGIHFRARACPATLHTHADTCALCFRGPDAGGAPPGPPRPSAGPEPAQETPHRPLVPGDQGCPTGFYWALRPSSPLLLGPPSLCWSPSRGASPPSSRWPSAGWLRAGGWVRRHPRPLPCGSEAWGRPLCALQPRHARQQTSILIAQDALSSAGFSTFTQRSSTLLLEPTRPAIHTFCLIVSD